MNYASFKLKVISLQHAVF